jgi:hypothetical protein
MTDLTRHEEVEHGFRRLLSAEGFAAPDECARLDRALVFVWYDPKALVLIDLDELPDADDPFEGFPVGALDGEVPFARFADTG